MSTEVVELSMPVVEPVEASIIGLHREEGFPTRLACGNDDSGRIPGKT